MSTATHHHDEIVIPKPLLYGAGLVVVLVVILTGLSSLTGLGQFRSELPPITDRVAVTVVDEADGGVGIYSADTGDHLYTYPAYEGGFVRTALRALATDRRKAGVGKEPPFELLRAEAGHILLHDPSTSKMVTLRAFGEGNAVTFERVFTAQSGGE